MEGEEAGREDDSSVVSRVLSSFVRVRLFSATSCLKPIRCHLFGHVTPVVLLHKFISVFYSILASFTVCVFEPVPAAPGLILLLYLLFYGFLAGMFTLTTWVM